jgi:hypothetical protein
VCGGQGLSPAEKKFGNFVEKQGKSILAKAAALRGVEANLWVLVKGHFGMRKFVCIFN